MFVVGSFTTSMRYPCNYGFIPARLCRMMGDQNRCAVVGQRALLPGCIVRARPVGD